MSSPPLPVSREMLVRVVSVLDRDQLAEVLVRSLAGLVAIDEAVKTDAAMVAYVGGRGYRRCISLQPGRWSGLSEVEFCSLYRAQLARLDPEQVVKTLADQSGGRPIALLCWERPRLHLVPSLSDRALARPDTGPRCAGVRSTGCRAPASDDGAELALLNMATAVIMDRRRRSLAAQAVDAVVGVEEVRAD